MKPSYSFPIFLILLILLFSGVYYGLTIMKSGQGENLKENLTEKEKTVPEENDLVKIFPKQNLPNGLAYEGYEKSNMELGDITTESVIANYSLANKTISVEIASFGNVSKAKNAYENIKQYLREKTSPTTAFLKGRYIYSISGKIKNGDVINKLTSMVEENV